MNEEPTCAGPREAGEREKENTYIPRKGKSKAAHAKCAKIPLEEKDIPRFKSKLKPVESGCWEWTAGLRSDGYGSFRVGRQCYSSHRVSYLIAHGSLPEELLVCHKCDNRKCVNPDHLFLGTYQDNSLDMLKKKRHVRDKTAKKTHCKFGHAFTPETIRITNLGHMRCLICDRRLCNESRKKREQKFSMAGLTKKGKLFKNNIHANS